MKENIFDVLMYLFDNYLDDEYEINSNQTALRQKLLQAGFGDKEVGKAFDWLESLTLQNSVHENKASLHHGTYRIFNEEEMNKLNTDCRGLLTYLENAGVLDINDRELVIDRVMALESEEIDLYQLKWVVLMVLLNQPGKEAAFSWMEGVVMDQMEVGLH